MLEIKANKTILIDEEPIDLGNGSMKEFLMSVLGCPVKLEEDLLLSDLIHMLYDIRDFINLYCSEEYEVLRVLVNAGKMAESADYLRIFKSSEVTSDNFLKINVQSEIESYDESPGVQNLCKLKIVLDSEIIDAEDVLREGIELKADFTLLEIIEVLYEDFLFSLKKQNILV